jgi:transposase
MYQLPKDRDLGVNACSSCLEKQREIDRLRQEVTQLKAKLRYRERNQQQGPFGSSTPSSQIPLKTDSPDEHTSKVGGAKAGHKGHGRKAVSVDTADLIETVSVDANCPECGGLLESKGSRERTVIDIDPIEPIQKLYRLGRKYCPRCHISLQAQAPGVLPRSLLTNQLIAEIVDSHYLQGTPLGRICQKFSLGLGTVIDTLHRVGRILQPAMADLIAEYREAAVRHADETSWRTDGKSGYCWLFSTETVSIFLYRQTRSARVAREVLGTKPLPGVLVVDRYNGYNKAPCKLQYCYAHLSREVEDLAREFADSPEVEVFTSALIPLLGAAMHLRAQPITDSQYYKQARQLKKQIREVSESPAEHLGIRRIQDIFVENAGRLYQWVEDRRVPAENNRAERELRPTVIARKVSFGSQSDAGAKTREVLMSLMQTMRKRVASPRQRLKEVLDKVAEDAEADAVKQVLANDSS